MPITIHIFKGDITTAATEAIVNAANNEFWMGSGVAGAIKSAGGTVIETEAMAKGPVMPGQAVWTGAGKLRFKYVIHAAAMGQDLRTTDRLIRQATVAALQTAEDLKIGSVALPAFGTGVGGFPLKACAKIMISTARSFETVALSLTRVEFWLFDETAFGVFKAVAGSDQ
jgi:O-acetyl-ADP-ribose deacetylase (regulator of RNase III)